MKILVTGGAGFIGSHVVDSFLASGYEVVVVDNLSTGREQNINPLATFHQLDIRDPALGAVFDTERPDIISHHAAQMDLRKSVADPLLDAGINVLGSINLFECAREFGVKKIIYSSSGGAIYGEPEYLPCNEEHPANPICQYGVSKQVVEKYLYTYSHLYGVDYVVLRYANVYGPRQDPFGEAGVVAIFIGKMLKKREVHIHGDGSQERDFVYVADCARANVLAAMDGVSGIYNVGCGSGTSINSLHSLLKQITGFEGPTSYGPQKAGETSRIFLDSSRIAADLSWNPTVELADGLRRSTASFRKELHEVEPAEVEQRIFSTIDRRISERKDLVYYFGALDKDTNQLLGYVANVSIHGMMLVTKEQVEPNRRYKLELRLPEKLRQNSQIVFIAESRWCRRNSIQGYYNAGFKMDGNAAAGREFLQSVRADTAFRERPEISAKKLLDVAVSFIGLVLLSPIFLLICLAIKLHSPGPAFYNGIRVGKYGRPFRMHKFRTMEETHEGDGPRITAQDDPRVPRLGRFLRHTKLNELPQLYNVLKGEMSLVGPRPEVPEYVSHYGPEEREVLSVKPGITSLASVLYADEESMLSFSNVVDTYLRDILPDKLHLDILYVRNRSLLLDLDILIQTVLVLIPRLGRAAPSAEDILSGPFRIARRLLTWFIIDAIIAFMSVGLSGVLWRSAGPLDVGVGRSLLAALAMAAIFSLANWLSGVQRVQWRYASTADAIYVIGSAIAATILILVGNANLPQNQFPGQMLIVSGLLATSGFLLARYHRRILADLLANLQSHRAAASTAREKVLIVGGGELGQLVIRLLQRSTIGQAFHIIGVIDDDLNKLGTLLHRIPVLGLSDRVQEIARQYGVGTIIFANPGLDEQRRSDILRRCRESGARVVMVQDLLESFQPSEEIQADDFQTSTHYRYRDQDPGNIEAKHLGLHQEMQGLADSAQDSGL